MQPIIFCDVNHGSKLEKFMAKNMDALKKAGYNKFVLQSDNEGSVKETVAQFKGSISMFDTLLARKCLQQ